MNSSRFAKYQLKLFCSILGCKPNEIKYITEHIDDYYRERVEPKINKETGEYKRFKDGTTKQRTIHPSQKRLKVLQRAIKDKILKPIPLPHNIHGGVSKKSNITNAKVHKGNKYKFTTDLKEFYPSISNSRVYKTFVSLGLSNHFSYWLTKLTTYKYQIPQGAPTSTHLANLVYLEIDKQLIEFCKIHSLKYTRYIDDLSFSSQSDFKYLLNDIISIITKSGFNVNYRKTLYKGNQTLTGIDVFNNYIDAPKAIKEKAEKEKLSGNPSGPYTNYQNTIRKVDKLKVRI